MASQRPRLSTPHRRRQPARHHTLPTQRALQDMLAGMASLVHGTRAPTVTRTPAPVTPEKCEMEMTAAEFRTWRRSVESWSDQLSYYRWSEPGKVEVRRLSGCCDVPCGRTRAMLHSVVEKKLGGLKSSSVDRRLYLGVTGEEGKGNFRRCAGSACCLVCSFVTRYTDIAWHPMKENI
ncbi:hypothetical protein GWK47_030449 [Chionoecetes opilio]|uniref:Uncharacterized protein n=1 Tax=Chionoecetes opilio TaxID=41210 RepID=A0A8J5D4Q5_CHIOP|nr:hypothetical protein GWK47_030449 [Chionoecetes opilio]